MFQPRVSRYINNDNNHDIEKGNIDIVSIKYDNIVDLLFFMSSFNRSFISQ